MTLLGVGKVLKEVCKLGVCMGWVGRLGFGGLQKSGLESVGMVGISGAGPQWAVLRRG
jgi:hypothetical protein